MLGSVRQTDSPQCSWALRWRTWYQRKLSLTAACRMSREGRRWFRLQNTQWSTLQMEPSSAQEICWCLPQTLMLAHLCFVCLSLQVKCRRFLWNYVNVSDFGRLRVWGLESNRYCMHRAWWDTAAEGLGMRENQTGQQLDSSHPSTK